MGVFKRGHTWWMSFSYRGERIQKSTGVRDRKLAERIYYKVMAQVAEGKWFEKPLGADKTFREMMEKYEKENFSGLASGTRRGCKSYFDGLVEFFGGYAVSEIKPRMIHEFKQMRKAEGVKPATINRQLTIMKRAYNIAIRDWEWLDSNPVSRVASERANNARDKWLTLEEEKRLLDNCVLHPTIKKGMIGDSFWLQEIVVFALNTGMRQGEILSLQWPDVDLFRKTATVVRSKNGEKRTIPLNQRMFELLKSKAKVRRIDSNLVFASEAGTKIVPANLLRSFYKALRRAGITDFRFHDLRHTFATRLAQAGVDFYKISKLLGHKDVRMTQRYSHHYPESLRDGVAVLDKIPATILQQSDEKGAIATT